MTAVKAPSDHRRPATGGKRTPRTRKDTDEALDQGLKLTIEGVTYEARIGDVTPEMTRELRRETGMGFFQLVETIATYPDADVISAFVWVARRVAGEHIGIEQVSISYKQILSDGFDVDLPGKSEVDDNPEA